ncbi:MAG: amino acid ABC transporter permease [Cellvibrionaceae bacterium]
MDYQFLWRPVFQALPQILSSAQVTLEVSILSMLIGSVIGLFLYFARTSVVWPVKFLAGIWIEIARNTPALFQLFFFKFGLAAIGIILDSYLVVVMALSFNTAGYMAETFRGGFNAIHPAQLNSARSLGMSFFQAQYYIIVPQVIRAIYHPMSNQLIWVILMSSLGMLVGLRELSGETQFLYSKTFRAFEFFAATAIIYYIIAKIALGVMKLIAWRLFKGQ